ncbi:MAG: hypothetical protein AAF371_04410 [Pseudomonadota bacterium]
MTHLVKPGESLSLIAQQHYGDAARYPLLFEENAGTIGSNPNIIHAGMMLRVPCADATSPSVDTAAASRVTRRAPLGIQFTVPTDRVRSTAARSGVVVSPGRLARLIAAEGGTRIIDLRSRDALGDGAIAGAISLPFDTWGAFATDEVALRGFLVEMGVGISEPIVVVPGGHTYADLEEAARAYWLLKAAGAERLSVLDGDRALWQREGLAVSKLITVPLDLPANGEGSLSVGARPELLPEAVAIVQASMPSDATDGATLSAEVDVPLVDLAVDTVGNFKSLDLPWGEEPVHIESDGTGIAALAWFLLAEVAGISDVHLLHAARTGTLDPAGGIAGDEPSQRFVRLVPGAVKLGKGAEGREIARTRSPSLDSPVEEPPNAGSVAVSRPSVDSGLGAQPDAARAAADTGTTGSTRVGHSSAPAIRQETPGTYIMSLQPISPSESGQPTVPPSLRQTPPGLPPASSEID